MSNKNKSDFFENVYTVVKKIPFGKVTSYGAIAKYLGVSTQTIHRDVRKMKLAGIDVPGSRQHWNEPILALEREQLYNTISKKREEGFTLTEIAKDLDMPYRKIQDKFEEMKIFIFFNQKYKKNNNKNYFD